MANLFLKGAMSRIIFKVVHQDYPLRFPVRILMGTVPRNMFLNVLTLGRRGPWVNDLP